MNTKHTRAVVSLFLAIATLATMGFSATHEDDRTASILPDHITCELIEPSLTAIELLEFVGDSCYSGLVDRIETEIDRGISSSTSTQALLDSILERSRATSTWSVDLLELSETEVESVSPLTRPSTRSDVGDEWSIDYHNPSSAWADAEQFGHAPAPSVRSGAGDEWSIDYHNPSSAWADAEQFGHAPAPSARSRPAYELSFDLSELYKTEVPAERSRPAYELSFDLSKLYKTEVPAESSRPAYELSFDLSELYK